MATVTIAQRQRRNGKTYIVQFKDQKTGKKKYHKSFRRKDLAQEEANRLRTIIDSGEVPTPKKQSQKATTTFGEMAQSSRLKWQRKYTEGRLSQESLHSYLAYLKPIEEMWRSTILIDLNTEALLSYRTGVAIEKSPALANRRLFVIKQVFAQAVKQGVLNSDPAKGIRYLSERQHERKRTLTPKQVSELLNQTAKGRTKHYLSLCILLAVEHGASRQEILDLKWSDIQLDHGDGRITFHRTKNDVTRTHFLMPRTRKAIIQRMQHLHTMRNKRSIPVKGDHVIGYVDGRPFTTFRKAWDAVCKELGWDDLHFHDTRHVYCSNIIMAGGSLKHAKEMIGHRTLRMTDRYAHLESAQENPVQTMLAKRYESAT